MPQVDSHFKEGEIVGSYGTQNFNFNCTLKKMDFSSEHFCIMAKLSQNQCCTNRLLSDFGAPIEIPCYFDQNLSTPILTSNNMGRQWEQLNLTVIG